MVNEVICNINSLNMLFLLI